jgi:hypothetical protein
MYVPVDYMALDVMILSGQHLLQGPLEGVGPENGDFSCWIGKVMDQLTIKTPNPKCHLYWCLSEFRDWRMIQSVMLVFSTSLVN